MWFILLLQQALAADDVAADASGSPEVAAELMTLDPEIWIQYAVPAAQALFQGVFILTLTWIASKWVNRMVINATGRAKMEAALGGFLASIAQYTVLAAGVIASLGAFGIQTTSVTAIFASAGIAVGLALQGSLSNFAAGVMILFFRPFALGDFVSTTGQIGTVKDIGLFATTLLTPSNETVIVPNSGITNTNIVNYTTQGTRRGAVDIGVAYGADLQHVQQVVLAAANKLDIVLHDPMPATAFVEMAASSLNFKLFVWCKSEDYLAMLHEVRSACYDALNEAGIEIPYDQVVMHQAPTDEA